MSQTSGMDYTWGGALQPLQQSTRRVAEPAGAGPSETALTGSLACMALSPRHHQGAGLWPCADWESNEAKLPQLLDFTGDKATLAQALSGGGATCVLDSVALSPKKSNNCGSLASLRAGAKLVHSFSTPPAFTGWRGPGACVEERVC